MNVRNCRGCGHIFNYVTGPILCQACKEKMENKFQEVKDFIRENPGVGIPEVSEACEVDSAQIRQWLRDDRLELTSDSAIMLNCEGCGAFIRSGRYCDKCKYNLTTGFQDILKAEKPKDKVGRNNDKENPKMRFLK